ncbi:MFS transporter [Tepidiforma sp.]|uniref:MFS transporter n=1 Tax=Tepidiforma sp. TaxID=2682230 RepID=UPI002ADD9003|nr:MFS transporter [Tepidiforma sp.]
MAPRFVPGADTTFRALRHRNYRLLWLGQTGHSATLWMDQVARAVLILQLTDSAVMLSLVIATRLAPILFFGLIAGAVADRYDKKRILTLTQCVSTACHLFIGSMAVTGLVEVWHVFVTAAVAGTAMAFNQPVRQSLIPRTVPPEDLLNAVALNSTALSFMRIGGGSLAGALLIVLDVGGVYLVTAGIYVLVIITTLLMRFEGPERTRPRRDTGLFADLAEGFRYIASQPVLGIVTALSLILFILGFPYQQVFVPLLATRTLDLGDSGVGFLAGATGVGAFAGSLFVASRSNIARPGLQLMINMLIFGGALVAISLQSTVWLTALLLAVAGSMTVTYMAFTNGILLSNSDPEMHGRVMSLLSLDRGLIPLGAIFAGFLVQAIGVRPGLFALGALIILLSSTVLLLFGRRLAAITSAGAARGHGAPPLEPGPSASPSPVAGRAPNL